MVQSLGKSAAIGPSAKLLDSLKKNSFSPSKTFALLRLRKRLTKFLRKTLANSGQQNYRLELVVTVAPVRSHSKPLS